MDAQADRQLIEGMAAALRRWGMTAPAILLLEAHRPFSFVLSQALLVAEPALGFFFGYDRSQQFARLLENPDNVERLLQRLETEG